MRWLFLALALLASPAEAQSIMSIVNARNVANYVGPVDAVPGATACYSLSGCSAAYAGSGTNSAALIRRQSDNTTKEIVVLSNGAFDSASALAFGGIDVTATCSSVASTSLSCTGASSQPVTTGGDEITGTGITGPAFVTACGTFTVGTGTCTMNVARTVASTTVTFHVGLFIRVWRDQTLGNKCASASCDIAAAVNANQPLLLLNCLNSGTLPCAAAPPSGPPTLSGSNNFTPATGVMTIVAVANRPSGTGNVILRVNGATGSRIATAAGANTWSLLGGSSGTISATASDGTAHAAAGVVNGASSALYIDNTSTAGTAAGSTTAAVAAAFNTVQPLYTGELLWYDNMAFSAGQVSTMHTNQAARWGTP